VAEASDPAVESVLDTNDGFHTLGARDKSGAMSQFFTGTLDEVQLYDLTLSAAEVQTLYGSVTPGGNSAPVVGAGPDATIRLPVNTVALNGSVSDDGQPIPAPITAWSVFSGPPGVTFGDASMLDTTATFPGEGTYVLQLSADDTELQASDTVTVIVEAAPVLAELVVTPADVSLLIGSPQLFSASGADQYGVSFPVTITWSATGGSIDQAGNYTAGAIPGPFTVTATDGGVASTLVYRYYSVSTYRRTK